MSFGETLKESLKVTNTEQAKIACKTHYSPQSVSGWISGKRKIPEEMLPQVNSMINYPFLYLESALIATNGVSLPYMDGDFIQKDRLALVGLVRKETQEAMKKLAETHLFKPPEFATDQDRQNVSNVNEEVLEAACAMVNLVGWNCWQYKLSVKKTYGRLQLALKSRRLRK